MPVCWTWTRRPLIAPPSAAGASGARRIRTQAGAARGTASAPGPGRQTVPWSWGSAYLSPRRQPRPTISELTGPCPGRRQAGGPDLDMVDAAPGGQQPGWTELKRGRRDPAPGRRNLARNQGAAAARPLDEDTANLTADTPTDGADPGPLRKSPR